MSSATKKLKEFDLDAPSLSKELRHAFRLQTRFLTSNVERNFRALSNSVGAWKVLVEVVPAVTKDRSRSLLGVLTTQVAGDPASYLAMKHGEREQIALDWLLAGVRAVFSEHGWPCDGIEDAVRSVVAANFRNVLVWREAVFNNAKSATVDVVVEWDNAQAKIVALFRTHGSQHVQASTLCVRSPSEFDFFRCLGKLTWTDDDTIQLTSRGGSESWTATRVVPH